MHRNDVVFGFQGNRNPFIDHPEWVGCLYSGACSVAVAYCTSSTTSNGCVPSMSATGTPSVTANSGFVLSTLSVEGQRSGLIFYGTSGAASSVWAIGSTSWLCVKAPTQRMSSLNSGGANNTCTGVFATDWLNWLSTHPNALGQPFTAGIVVRAQAWFRDPPAPGATNLSNAIQFTTSP